MKMLFFTDLHLLDRSITTRVDNSSEAGLVKLRKICLAAMANKVDMVVSGGDEFHAQVYDKEFLNRVLSDLADLKYEGIPFYSVMSNHVVRFGSFEDYFNRDIGTLVSSKLLSWLVYEEQCQLLGIHAYTDFPDVEESEDIQSIVAHAYLKEDCPFPEKEGELFVSVKELKKKFVNLEYLFLGHDHQEYPVKEIDGVKIFRIGGALRVSSARENLNRVPQAMIFDFDTGEYSFFPLSDKKGEEVFNLKVKDIRREIKDFDINSFMSSVNNKGDNILSYLAERYNSIKDEELKNYIGKNYLSGVI
jgi:DNA repair exonuclease SbcCD nuclease subunit